MRLVPYVERSSDIEAAEPEDLLVGEIPVVAAPDGEDEAASMCAPARRRSRAQPAGEREGIPGLEPVRVTQRGRCSANARPLHPICTELTGSTHPPRAAGPKPSRRQEGGRRGTDGSGQLTAPRNMLKIRLVLLHFDRTLASRGRFELFLCWFRYRLVTLPRRLESEPWRPKTSSSLERPLS